MDHPVVDLVYFITQSLVLQGCQAIRKYMTKTEPAWFTFRTIIALGYSISMDKPPSRIRTVRLPNEPFLQTNGYKPAPLDLSAIELNVKMEELVDQLAENTHNVWAKERISQVCILCRLKQVVAFSSNFPAPEGK